jgi:predicted transposase/invertase (TIGR01784 family)
VIEAIIAVAPHKKEDIMTAAQQLRQEGAIKGIQQGMQQEKLHIAKNMLSEGLATNLIKKLAGISEEEFRQLEKTYSKENQ